MNWLSVIPLWVTKMKPMARGGEESLKLSVIPTHSR